MAHQIGHAIGIYHDFDPKNGGTGISGSGNCADVSDRSIMSYGPQDEIWSQCSRNNFREYYNSIQDSWCMERKLII